MNRVGLKDYLLNHADDNDLLDCAKAWDAANEYGQFDIYGSVEEAAELNDWNVAQTLNESRHVDHGMGRELAYGKLFQGFENVADIPYSGPVVDPIALLSTFGEDAGEKHAADGSLRSLATLLSGADVINTKSVHELLDTMSDRFGLEPEERARIAVRAQAKEQVRTQGPDIGVEIDSQNDDGFITGTVTVDGESCYFSCPNNSQDSGNHDAVILEPLRPDGFGGDFGVAKLPIVIDENRDIVELVVSVAATPYMDSDKLPGCEQSLDSLCDEKTDEAQSMRYGMEGVGLPMLDAAEHLANY